MISSENFCSETEPDVPIVSDMLDGELRPQQLILLRTAFMYSKNKWGGINTPSTAQNPKATAPQNQSRNEALELLGKEEMNSLDIAYGEEQVNRNIEKAYQGQTPKKEALKRAIAFDVAAIESVHTLLKSGMTYDEATTLLRTYGREYIFRNVANCNSTYVGKLRKAINENHAKLNPKANNLGLILIRELTEENRVARTAKSAYKETITNSQYDILDVCEKIKPRERHTFYKIRSYTDGNVTNALETLQIPYPKNFINQYGIPKIMRNLKARYHMSSWVKMPGAYLKKSVTDDYAQKNLIEKLQHNGVHDAGQLLQSHGFEAAKRNYEAGYYLEVPENERAGVLRDSIIKDRASQEAKCKQSPFPNMDPQFPLPASAIPNSSTNPFAFTSPSSASSSYRKSEPDLSEEKAVSKSAELELLVASLTTQVGEIKTQFRQMRETPQTPIQPPRQLSKKFKRTGEQPDPSATTLHSSPPSRSSSPSR